MLYDLLIKEEIGFTAGSIFATSAHLNAVKSDNFYGNGNRLPPRLSNSYTNEYLVRLNEPNNTWENFLIQIRNENVMPGDLIFFHTDSYDNWSHVGIITGAFQKPTYFSFHFDDYMSQDYQAPNEPRMIDHSGITELAPSLNKKGEDPCENGICLPRSIGDTRSTNIEKIVILHQPK